MKIIKLDEIQVPEDRQRKEFDAAALSDLCDDIAINGLQHAPVVRAAEDRYVLVSGERRLRAIKDLASAGIAFKFGTFDVPLDYCPVVDFGELSPRQAKIMELHENIKRRDLSWQERARAEDELHQLRSEEKAEAGKQQTYTATAEELLGRPLSGSTEQAYAATQVRESVVLAKYLDDPAVAKAPTAKEALKIVQKKEIERHYAQLAERLGKTQVASRHTLLRGDGRFLLPDLPAESFDCILTDPPYGISAQDFGTQVSKSHKFDDSPEEWAKLMMIFGKESYRVAKPEAHLYVFCDPRNFANLSIFIQCGGWDVWPVPLIWNKRTGMLPKPEHGPRRTYEAILFANKGNKRTTAVYADVIEVPVERTTIHPDQKPVELYVNLLQRSVRPGQFVLDPFAGSGTIFIAANKLQLTATGIELEETSFALAAERMKQPA